jgi:hypothetical protein
MTDNGSPKMSVIILTPDCYETIRKTMGCLRAQTVRDQLEIIIVATAVGCSDVRVDMLPSRITGGHVAGGGRHSGSP